MPIMQRLVRLSRPMRVPEVQSKILPVGLSACMVDFQLVSMMHLQHDGRGREGSLELWKMVVLLCAPLMLLSLAEHLLEGSLIPHNCWPARLLTSLLSCAWLGFIALAQQQGWLKRCWPQKAAAPAERAGKRWPRKRWLLLAREHHKLHPSILTEAMQSC